MNGALLLLMLLAGPDAGTSWNGWPPDSGRTEAKRAPVKAEDQEVVKNLELLEHLDETSDLELLQELSTER